MNFDIKKIIRGVVITMSFMTIAYLYGMRQREAQQYLLMLGCMGLFGFLLDNIWISVFLWWTLFLQLFFKDLSVGMVYVSNIFFGCILYYLTKISFKKEHIDTFINAILWLTAINLLYMIVQLFGFDWIFLANWACNETGQQAFIKSTEPIGFMGYKAMMGCLMAMAIPLLATRPYKWATIGSILLFIPLYIAKASICLIAGAIGLLWVIWHKIRWNKQRAILAVAIGILIMLCILFYVFRIDDTGSSLNLRLVAWQGILKDTTVHPITGWGLDSFGHQTKNKNFLYMMNPQKVDQGVHMDYLDNPHNLYISLMYEWGIVGIIILIGLLRKYGLIYAKAIKEPNTIALAGFLIVTLIVSLAQFPMFLSRMVVLIVPIVALWEVQTK